MLVLAQGISAADHAFLGAQTDVYVYPELDNLDQPISDHTTLRDFHENMNIPANWSTPSHTYREFLRKMMGMFMFMIYSF
jgi:hypothetical protein